MHVGQIAVVLINAYTVCYVLKDARKLVFYNIELSQFAMLITSLLSNSYI